MTCRAATPILLLAAFAGGCASVPDRPSHRSMINEALARAASQVRGCYRSPRVSFRGRQIITRLRVHYTPEGELAGLPVIIYQVGVTPENRPYAGRMAEAAIAAVMRCTPMRLPPDLYREGWSVFELTFSSNAVA